MRGTQKPESVAVTWNFGNEAEQYTQTETNIFLIVQVSKRNEKTVLQRTTFCAHVREEQNSIQRSLIPEYFASPFILVL